MSTAPYPHTPRKPFWPVKKSFPPTPTSKNRKIYGSINLPASMKEQAIPNFPSAIRPAKNPAAGTQKRASARWKPTACRPKCSIRPLGLRLFAMEDAECQEACFQIANDWMIDYCKVTPGRLIGIPMISLYNIKNAIKELERCKKAGMVGCLIWQVPPDHLPFSSDYYDPFWEAAGGTEHAGELAYPHRIQLQPLRAQRTRHLQNRRQRQGQRRGQYLIRSRFSPACCRVSRN